MSLIKQKNSNKISSDIDDIDDEIIFNIDDTDSLSSAGTTDLIHNSNTNNNNSSFKITTSSLSNKIKCNSDTDNIKLKTSNNSKSSTHSLDTNNNNKIVNSYSISDIDPDDNLLNNLLVKQKTKENNKNSK